MGEKGLCAFRVEERRKLNSKFCEKNNKKKYTLLWKGTVKMGDSTGRLTVAKKECKNH